MGRLDAHLRAEVTALGNWTGTVLLMRSSVNEYFVVFLVAPFWVRSGLDEFGDAVDEHLHGEHYQQHAHQSFDRNQAPFLQQAVKDG